MLVDRSGFRYQVLVADYGEVGGRLEVGGRSCSSWWREVGRIRDGGGDYGGGWFGECVSKKLGDGSDTLFWYDKWLGSVSFCERFPRLFDLSENKSITVAGLFSLGVERGGEAWEWRRRLWAWEEEELEECRALLTNVYLQDFISDRWVWLSDPVEGYTVRGSYHMVTTRDVSLRDPAVSLIWHNQVPLKVSLFAWRLLRDRLSTKVNLA
ncbi:putative reverse transcriptase zinc-binding domain-containing protein [Medicago truncatula]|uniref:Putative reverse transcriptase zinc-binding domain-containing protein n=1 Tax=Medicago truncatula TaxID=3880 RepID=A0A396HG13_MEDTR|nr:putative reverse transcriptase zinc-binding domain-containing protein [Medicago truncatula]